MKKVLGIVLCLILVSGCATSHLKNGEESVVKFEEGGISAEDLYEVLKNKYGVDELVNLIDDELLSREYETDDAEREYVSQVISSLKNEWGDSFSSNIKAYYGVSDEDELESYVTRTYRRNLYLEEYAKSQVNDTQINDYYEDVAIGDIEGSHILISVNASSSMSDDEKKKAEEEALKTAKEVIEKLNNGESFEDLAKEYSDDEATSGNGGSLGSFNYRDNFDDNFMDAAVKLKVGKYTTSPVKSQYGYHIIYKTAQEDKPALEDIKEEIISIIADEAISSNSNMSSEAMLDLREKYGIEITDSDLEKDYNTLYGLE